MKGSDALDHRSHGKPRYSKSQKRVYAIKMREESLVEPPKCAQRPEWMNDPAALPKKPPKKEPQ